MWIGSQLHDLRQLNEETPKLTNTDYVTQYHISVTCNFIKAWLNLCENYLIGREPKTYNCWNDVEKPLKLEILLKLLFDKSKIPNSNPVDAELKIKSILILPLMLLVLKFLNIFQTIK
jgi:hypothetical protein